MPDLHPSLAPEVRDILSRIHRQRDGALFDRCVAAMAQARSVGDGAAFIALAKPFATLMDQRGQAAEGLELLHEALALARAAHGYQDQAELQVQIGGVHYGRGAYLEALDSWAEAMEVAQRVGDTVSWGWAKLGLGQICDAFDSAPLAVRVFAELAEALRALPPAQEAGERVRELYIAVHMNLGVNQMRLGELQAANEQFLAALGLAREWGATDAQAHAHLRLAEVAWAQGRARIARQELEHAEQQARACAFGWALAQVHLLQARMHLADDALRPAQQAAEAALQQAQQVGARHVEMHIERLRSELFERSADLTLALHCLRRANALQREVEQGSRAQALRDLEDLTGRRAGAARHLLELAGDARFESDDPADRLAALALLCRESRQALHVDRVQFWEPNGPGRWRSRVAEPPQADSPGLALTESCSLAQRLAAGQPVVAQSCEHHQDCWPLYASHFAVQGVQAVLIAPVQVSGQTRALLFFEQIGRSLHWGREAPALAMQAATLAARVLAQADRAQQAQQLQLLNAELEAKVLLRTQSLQQRNEELAQTLQQLRDAQGELVRAGKLAALGALVAGVAHELNTPVGNAFLAADTLGEDVRAIEADLASGALSRGSLTGRLGSLADASLIIDRNLRKASELVQSFKQVAVDQTSDQQRPFQLAELVRELLMVLRPRLRQGALEVEVEVPEGLDMDSRPGALGQVLGNLIENALLHGYEGQGPGRVWIRAWAADARRIGLSVRDTGRGMAPAVRERIFDPFFTTRMGRGGTGLGLTIVHNLVVDLLRGSIEVESQPGEGSCFTMLLPARL